ncbi:MAG TPA: mandelate racemase/muconate lactonizing enzyme family protein [Chloroflexota bacterium]|jgi:L-alanine-DL-glutamate epimerase-like enolase superfamily enzyme|nr:mandelate racemase/muconate lactonizing enzyme family protein [Chloroflexota bacterium]
MKITGLETQVRIDPPPARPITDAWRANRHPGGVTLLVHTDAGLVGRGGGSFASIKGAHRTFATLLEEEVAPLVVGRDPLAIRQLNDELKKGLEEQGTAGLTAYARAAVDVALWDILGQVAGQPVHRLLGQAKDRLPAYAMVGWMHFSADEVAEACAKAMDQGFKAVKVKVGSPTLEDDLRRLEGVRRAVGHTVQIFCDANQSLTPSEALRRGRALAELGVGWLEEPVIAHNYDGYATVAHGLDLPVAGGENLYGSAEFAELFKRNAIDVVQGDLARNGGVSGCIEVGHAAAAFGLPYCSHGGGLVNLNILCALPNALWLETGMLDGEWRERFVDGCVLAPEGPGFRWT